MGYRSDVAIAIYGQKDHMTAFIAASRLTQNFAEIFKECEIYPYSGIQYGDEPSEPHLMLSAKFESVKWYDGYEDVDRWTKFVSLAGEQEEFINSEFVRTGEDIGDIEEDRAGPDVQFHLGINCEVYTDLPEKQELV